MGPGAIGPAPRTVAALLVAADCQIPVCVGLGLSVQGLHLRVVLSTHYRVVKK